MTGRMRRLFAAVMLPAVLTAVALPALSLEREGMAVSRKSPKVNKTYSEPILANNTSLLHKPSDCRTATYCDTIELKVDAADFENDDVYYVDIVLSWPQEYTHTEEGDAQSNDLDLYIYDSNELRIGQAATSNEKEKTQIDLPPSGEYYLVVNNFYGPNLGYTFDIKMTYAGKQKEIPEFIRSTPRPLPPPPDGPASEPLPTFTPAPETDLEPDATLAPVITPGPDGKMTTLSLDAVQAGTRTDDGGLSWWATLLVALMAAGIVGGAGFFLYRRVRRA